MEDLDDFRASVRSFCAREIDRELARRIDREDRVPAELVGRMAELGYMGVAFPEEYGGGGGTLRELVVLAEELSAVSSALSGIVVSSAVFGGLTILLSGTAEQRGDLLPQVCRGELLSAMAVTEPDAGSDVAAVKTRAVRDPGGWTLTGTKMFTSGALEASIVMVVARCVPESTGHRGLGLFLVPNPSPGLQISKLEKIGNRGLSTCEVVLDEVRLPPGAVLGGPDAAGSGWTQLMRTFEAERVTFAAMSVGIAQRALDDAVTYARDRHQFGRPIGEFQAVGHLLAEMATQVEAARALVSSVAAMHAQGRPCGTEAAMAKLFATERAKEVCLQGMQVLGGYGYLPEFDMERHLRDALLGPVGAGTSQIQRSIIARAMGFSSATRTPPDGQPPAVTRRP